jgi:hypothetical protein
MTEAPADLLQAVYGLKRAAEAEFQGNGYYLVANEIAGLIEVLGGDVTPVPPINGAVHGFASALGDVRKAAESSLSGNSYYLASHRLDVLSSFLPPSSKEAQLASKPQSAEVVRRKVPFGELAAASAARVEEVAASLGLAPDARHVPPAHAEASETPSNGELERRSSEPCSMAELAPPTLEPVAPAAVSAEIIAPAASAQSKADLGSPSASSGPLSVQGTVAEAPAKTHSRPEVQASAAAHDRQASSAGKKIEVRTGAANKSQEPKTLFKLWLDLVFGRKG